MEVTRTHLPNVVDICLQSYHAISCIYSTEGQSTSAQQDPSVLLTFGVDVMVTIQREKNVCDNEVTHGTLLALVPLANFQRG